MIRLFFLSVACLFNQSHAQAETPAQWDLGNLLRIAVHSHPSVAAQQALLGAAQQGVTNARWQYFPTPSVSVQGAKASGADPSYAGDSSVTVLALNQALWTGGRIEAVAEIVQISPTDRESLMEPK